MNDTNRYRPSNGTEGEAFISHWCGNCKHDDVDLDLHNGCQVLADTMAYDVDDDNYPKEWIIDETGQPKCTKFCHVDDSEKTTPKCTKTKDMFEVTP